LRRKQLERTFTTHYEDLLRAISTDNYDAIDALCEETLTLELAAKIYEFEKHRKVQFRVASPASPIELDIINHFYVSNMSINRKENPSLSDFKMVTKKRNWIEYIPKGSEERELDPETYKTLEELK